MLTQKSDLTNQARRLISTAHLMIGGVKTEEDLKDECDIFVILCRGRDPGYIAHLEAWIAEKIDDRTRDMFDDWEGSA